MERELGKPVNMDEVKKILMQELAFQFNFRYAD
jgi:hypothetical protein